MVALHDAVAFGYRRIVVPVALCLSTVANLAKVGKLVSFLLFFSSTRQVVIGEFLLIEGLQTLPGIIVLDRHKTGKVAEVLGRLCPDPEAATHTDVLVEEVGTLGIHHRSGTELQTQRLLLILKHQVFVAETHTHGDAEERRLLAIQH